ncbi:DUF4250 domain-containing protein [Clostridium sp. Sa3CUN1]|uniref:DUF4250 domain-containing protein n=1 Tax=Clostridium gallinarum TaxID=2762246 RepID=A0ABR8Q1A1_9CLOT|nr:DUF4250 domain-containing protein [Clostridium gallinarum]MBD7914191.1 DUF4250 domain-containing protein [Clostridium gallinarum]
MEDNQYINMNPNILLSIVNMKLRDFYSNLSILCDDLQIDEKMLKEKLNSIGYTYDENINQFK